MPIFKSGLYIVTRLVFLKSRRFRTFLLAGVAAIALSACASNRASTPSADYSGFSRGQTQANLAQISARYQANPNDIGTAIYFAAALRAAGQSAQAVAVMQQSISHHPGDPSVKVAYAKALSADGKFQQALRIVEETIQPDRPDWNALLVKGAILDQIGQNGAARQIYKQALTIAPQQASLEANLGLSYAMTNELSQAEVHLRKAVKMRRSTAQIRQNLALIVGLQGRFDEARSIYGQVMSAEQVAANMAFIRALLTQQNRWDLIPDAD